MEHSMYISFQMKRSKINKKGLAPIYLRITLDGKRLELSAHRRIPPASWDNQSGCAIGPGDETIILNNYLNTLKAKVQRQYNILDSLGKEITVDAIKNGLFGQTEKKYTLLNMLRYHNDEMKKRVGIDIALGTYKHYRTALTRLQDFIRHQYRKDDILLDDLNHAFITKFEAWLKTVHHCSHNTTTKHVKKLKKVVNMALANEWLLRDPFMKYKCSFKPTNRGYLNPNELNILEEKSFTIPRLQKVKDIFLFCCYTGLSQSDVESLTSTDISIGMDGEKWIIIYRKKTDTRSPIPILPKALAIIEKYKDDPEANANGMLLPVNTNQRMNGYLKEIADVCGIVKNLTMHLARHTFATTVTLANGVPIETVSKMLGHTSIKTTQIYSKVVDTKISHDMKALKNKMSDKAIKKAM